MRRRKLAWARGQRFIIHTGARLQDDAGRSNLGAGLTLHCRKNPVDCAHMKMHMLVQTGAKAVGEGGRADVQ